MNPNKKLHPIDLINLFELIALITLMIVCFINKIVIVGLKVKNRICYAAQNRVESKIL